MVLSLEVSMFWSFVVLNVFVRVDTMEEMLVPQEKYLEAGIHIGTKLKTSDMIQYIYKARQDKLYVLDLKKTDEKIRLAARFVSRYKPEDVMVVASRTYASNASKAFCKTTGCKQLAGRFVPGILTNPARDNFVEPKLILVSDPKGERQAVRESAKSGIPVIALCDTDNTTKFIDLIVPCNNKGKKSLALVFYLLAREVLKARGDIQTDADFKVSLQEFEEDVIPAEEGTEQAGGGGTTAATEAPVDAEVAAAPEEKPAEEQEAEKKPRKKKKEKKEGEPAEEATDEQ